MARCRRNVDERKNMPQNRRGSIVHYGNMNRIQILLDAEVKRFPLYCPKCKVETVINIEACS